MHGKVSNGQPSDGCAEEQAASRSARIRAGIERAKREGTRSGRPFGRPRLSEEILDAVRQSILEGDSLYQTVKKTGVGMGTVTRLRKELRAKLNLGSEDRLPLPVYPSESADPTPRTAR